MRRAAPRLPAASPGPIPCARVLIGTPTWPNHAPIIHGVGLETVEYPYYERGQGVDPLRRHDRCAGRCASRRRRPAPRLLPQSDRRRPRCTINGREVTRVVIERGLIPFVDIAYQGFGRGLDEDARGLARTARRLRRSDRRRRAATRISAFIATASARCGSRPGRRKTTRRAMAHVAPGCARNVVDAARSWRGGGADHPRRSPELRARLAVELAAMRDRINSVRAADCRCRPAPGLHRPAVRHVLDAAVEQGAGRRAARRTMRSTWPTAAASTSSAWPTSRSTDLSPPWSTRWTRNRSWLSATRAKCPQTSIGARSRGWS